MIKCKIMKHLVKLKQAGRGMIALIAEDIISVKEVDPTISMGAPVKVNTLHSEYYIMQPFDDGLTGLFRESPIQIRKKIREASLC